MSELREELLAAGNIKKRLIGITIVAGLLIAAFAFSTALISTIFGTQRLPPNSELADANEEKAILVLPPFPFNQSLFEKLFKNLNLTEEELQQLVQTLSEMLDGNIGQLDLSAYASLLLALMFSEVEVFRIYDYKSLISMADVLWKYECFDIYENSAWKSSASKAPYSFYSYEDYDSIYSYLDMLLLKMPLSSNLGRNSLAIPSLFPIPFIMDGSLSVPNIDPSLTVLYKDDLDCTTLDLFFNDIQAVDMKYELFGLNQSSGAELNATAIPLNKIASPTPEYSDLLTHYLILNGASTTIYRLNHPNFNAHWINLNNEIKEGDNAFIVANKIRNYLQNNFAKINNPGEYNPAPEGEDAIEWFCKEKKGYWSDFSSAFCAFTRAFGVAGRFVDGFNTIYLQESFDPSEGPSGKKYIPIKYKNMYNWAEIFVPTDASGNGNWIQMDVYYDSFGANPPSIHDYNLTVTSNFTSGYRPKVANLTANLDSNTGPVEAQSIFFTDLTTGQNLGTIITNANGIGSLLVNIDNSQVVGPHDISATYNPQTNAHINYTIYGNITVNLINVNPTTVNVSKTPLETTTVQGYVQDPVSNQRVKNAIVNFNLFVNGTNNKISNAFAPPPGTAITDANGNYVAILAVNSPPVYMGKYQIRVDFNGTWAGWPVTYGNINASSSRKQFNVTEELTYNIRFYINGTRTNFPNPPGPSNLIYAKRGQHLTLFVNISSALNGEPVQGSIVKFYDYTNNKTIPIATKVTDAKGNASIIYNITNGHKAGPTLLFAEIGNKLNCSYFILNETIKFELVSGPKPPVINRTATGSTLFNILCKLRDGYNNKALNFSEITLKMFRNSLDYSNYFNPLSNNFNDLTGISLFNISRGVQSNTPLDNYTLRLDFNGTFDSRGDLNPNNPYKTSFDFLSLNTSFVLPLELSVEDPSIFVFNFYINGTTSNNYTYPRIYKNGHLNLSVYIQWGKELVKNGEKVYFYDMTNKSNIGNAPIYGGRANFTYKTTRNTVAGPHLIYANYNNSKGGLLKYNYSYFILNAPINITLDKCPIPNTVNRSGTINTNFRIQGYLIDGFTGAYIKYGRIQVLLFEGTIDRSYYLFDIGGAQQNGNFFNCNQTGKFVYYFDIDNLTPAKNYTLRVDFNGTFIYNSPNADDILPFDNKYEYFLIDSIFTNFSYSANGLSQLRVMDPEDILILFKINGTSARTDYNDLYRPRVYKPGQDMNFTIMVYQSSNPINGVGIVRIYDVYNNYRVLYSYIPSGIPDTITLDTSLWYAGLHLIKVNWTGGTTFNSTYIVINKTVSISINLNIFKVIRNNSFSIMGNITGNMLNYSKGLWIKILLLEYGTMKDFSKYLIMAGSQFQLINEGIFNLLTVKINESCPQGRYLVRIDFNGTIERHSDNPLNVYLTKCMVNSSSPAVNLNITAGTSLAGYYYTEWFPTKWINNDICHVVGNLTWDNGTRIVGVRVNATVKNGAANIAFNSSITIAEGKFEITFIIDDNWDADDNYIYIFFYCPKDTIGEPDCYYIEQIINLPPISRQT